MRKLALASLPLVFLIISGCTPAVPTADAVPTTPVQDAVPSVTPIPPTSTDVPSPTSPPPTAEATQPPESPPEAPATPTPESPPPTAPAAASDCTNVAAFYGDVTIPDDTRFQQGEKFVKTWRIKNEGTCAWGPDYSMVFVGGAIMNGAPSYPMPPVAAGETTNISIDLTAPSQGGSFIGYYKFQDPQGNVFGVNSGGIDYFWVKIMVAWVSDTSTSPTTPPSGGTSGCSFVENQDFRNQVFTLINQARAGQGLPALVLNDKLNLAAMAHSVDMGCKDFVDHIGSDGSRWGDRISAQGYTASYSTENIYVGNPSFGGKPDGAMTWWMNSDIHRRSILTTKGTEIGIGYVFVEQSTYGGYYTVVFARP